MSRRHCKSPCLRTVTLSRYKVSLKRKAKATEQFEFVDEAKTGKKYEKHSVGAIYLA